ncbi:MAG: lipid-A-disaccharide synthase [Candidatus Omnitrophica bacterium]|nr:lipid-A-disaccharide synthase [Candidatus Omnitrophota bacterium]
MPKKILIIAGEASSDYHGSSLVKSIRALKSDVSFYGLGGKDMQNAGVEIIHNIAGMAVIGPVDAIKHYNELKKAYDDTCLRIEKDVPDCAVLIDYPGFNLKIAKFLKKHKVPVVYYISPQVWAWGRGRIKKIRDLVDKMLVLFKFEETLYKENNVDVSFVGHPLLDSVKSEKTKDDFLKQLGLSLEKLTIGILPGSRKNEVLRILPIMIESAKIIQKNIGSGNVQFLLPIANTIEPQSINNILKNMRFDACVIKNDPYNAVSACKAVMVASGTATLETALLGVPMAIVYKVSSLLYLFVRPMIKIPYIGLVNVVAGKKIVEEFIQYEARPNLIAEYMVKLLKDKDCYDNIKRQLAAVKSSLGSPGASFRAAEEVVKFL